MAAIPPAAATERDFPTVSVHALAWAAVGTMFIALRVAPIWRTDVGGAELAGLSGAWLASLGEADDRFFPTLFQAIAAGLFTFTESEVPARVVAFLATASIPVAVHRLRSQLSDAGALFALLLLALDGPVINLGVAASAMAFDLAVVCWLLVLAASRTRSPVAWGVAGFAAISAGAVVVPLVVAGAAIAAYRWALVDRRAAVGAVMGAVAAVLAASMLSWNLGDGGVTVPALHVFGASFEEGWSTSTTWEVGVAYGWPLLLAGAAALGAGLARAWRAGRAGDWEALVLSWGVLSTLWFASSAGEHSTAPYAAVALALAFVLGPELARILGGLDQVDWRFAGWLVGGVAVFMALIAMRLAQWAARDDVGPAGEQAAIAAFAVGGLICLGALAWERRARPALALGGAVVGVTIYAAAGIGVGVSGVREPVPSPLTTQQVRDLKGFAVAKAGEEEGTIVIHPDLVALVTWGMRGAGTVVVSNEPGDGAVLIWPLERDPPEGYSAVGQTWAVERWNRTPGDGLFGYVRWLANRNDTVTGSTLVVVYARDAIE